MTTITTGRDGELLADGLTLAELLAHFDARAEKCRSEGRMSAADDCELAAAALRHLSEQNEWQPIETAPRDGTEVDIWEVNRSGGKRRVPNCHFHCGKWLFWDSASVDDEPSWLAVQDPTHWRPLPPPPGGEK